MVYSNRLTKTTTMLSTVFPTQDSLLCPRTVLVKNLDTVNGGLPRLPSITRPTASTCSSLLGQSQPGVTGTSMNFLLHQNTTGTLSLLMMKPPPSQVSKHPTSPLIATPGSVSKAHSTPKCSYKIWKSTRVTILRVNSWRMSVLNTA